MTYFEIVAIGEVIQSQRGGIVIIFNQLVHVSKRKIILSSVQLEAFGDLVDDKSLKNRKTDYSDFR